MKYKNSKNNKFNMKKQNNLDKDKNIYLIPPKRKSQNNTLRAKNRKAKNNKIIFPKIVSGKDLGKILRDYKNFVKNNFSDFTFKTESNDQDQNKNIEQNNESKEMKAEVISNIMIDIKESKKNFEYFLDTIYPDFLEENIECDIPEITELYSDENSLGFKQNNINDYNRRETELFKDKIFIDETLPIDIPLTEINIEEDDIINNDNNINHKIGINRDEYDEPSPAVGDDQQKRGAACIILDYWEKNRIKINLFTGLDKKNKHVIIRIYGKKFDINRKLKLIEFNSYSTKFLMKITLEKTVKELFDVDSMSKEDLIMRIDDIINKFNQQK